MREWHISMQYPKLCVHTKHMLFGKMQQVTTFSPKGDLALHLANSQLTLKYAFHIFRIITNYNVSALHSPCQIHASTYIWRKGPTKM